ncbi:MAG: PH domain-containing protein [Oscillospiraceae bacterium]
MIDFVLYFIFRRFFVCIKTDSQGLYLRMGLILRRVCRIPVSTITAVRIKRTPLLRLLHASKITVRTLSGSVTFYLGKDEALEFLPESPPRRAISFRFVAVLFGALCETRALSETIVFSSALARIGRIFGSSYYNGIIAAINKTAENLSALLSALRITVPRITSVLAVFIAAAWLLAFVRNLLRLCRFSVRRCPEFVFVSHGIITLYEDILVRNNFTAAVVKSSAAPLFFRASPIYYGDITAFLPMRRRSRQKALHILTGVRFPQEFDRTPPAKALFGHIAVPLGWGGAAAAALALCYILGAGPILCTVLRFVTAVCIWYCIIFSLFMRYSGIAASADWSIISARRGVHLYTAYVLSGGTAYRRTDQNVFQLMQGMCDIRFYCRGRLRLRLRNMYLS